MTSKGQFIRGPWRSSLSKASEECSTGGEEVLFGVGLWRRQNTVLLFLFSVGAPSQKPCTVLPHLCDLSKYSRALGSLPISALTPSFYDLIEPLF